MRGDLIEIHDVEKDYGNTFVLSGSGMFYSSFCGNNMKILSVYFVHNAS